MIYNTSNRFIKIKTSNAVERIQEHFDIKSMAKIIQTLKIIFAT
jgi:hypothetical protein